MAVQGIDDPLRAFPDPDAADHITYNPSREALRAYSTHLETTTEFGSPAYTSAVKSRSADRTQNATDTTFTAGDWSLIQDAIAYANNPANQLICIDRRIGRHPTASYHGQYFVPKRYARIALALMNLLDPPSDSEPEFITIQLPEADDTAIRILPDAGLTCVLGSDYTGEAKKSFLRLFMHRVKQAGGLGLHAGSKRVRVQRNGRLVTVGQLFLGLSATGKTTLTCHDFGLTPPETTVMVQDDVCALLPDGTAAGSEGGGLYIKTIGLSPEGHQPLHHAATQPDAVLENVAVSPQGRVDFADDRHTANARAAVRRDHLAHTATDIDLDRVHQVFFITRNPLVPPIGRLSPPQAAAAFMLGESIETSAGNPEQAGEAVRVVGTNPFIIGAKGTEGNRFYELITELDIECFLLNTGQVGTDGREIRVSDTVSIVTAVAQDTVEWRYDDRLGLTVPAHIPGVAIDVFYPPAIVDGFDQKLEQLRRDRRDYLSQFSGLYGEITDATY